MSQYDLMLDLKIKWVTVIFILRFSDFTLYLEDYLSHYDLMFDLKIKVGHYDLYFTVR